MNLNQTEATAKPPDQKSWTQSYCGFAKLLEWFRRHPRSAIIAMAALAVTISCYPIIFCGRSYVSPASTFAMVYDRQPLVPGMKYMVYPSRHDSDTAAMMWWGVPLGFIESRSILDHGEIPLWNRYGHAGEVFLGQAVSMLGDPLQFIVILGRGSAIAWDIKFLTAKLPFCIGFGWLVLRLLENQSLSIIYAALAAYCGAFFYINNHPVFFVFAYTPWILLSALEMLAVSKPGWLRWGLIWLAANFACFNGGHVEVAVAFIGDLNLTALLVSLAACRGMRNQAIILLRVGAGTLLFLGLTAPVWVTFLVSLQHSFTAHEVIKATQLSPTILLGLFDDTFYHILANYNFPMYVAPGASLLILTGCIFLLLRWRQLKEDRFIWVNSGLIIFWIACVFGGLPGSLITMVPLLNRVGHIHVDFSYLLIIHLTLQSAYGFKSLLQKESSRQFVVESLILVVAMETILISFYAINVYWTGRESYVMSAAAGAVGAPLLFKYLSRRHGQIPLLGWVGIILLGFMPNYRFGLYNSGEDSFMILPGPRVVLNGSSPSLNRVKNDADPYRTVAMGLNLIGNYSAVYGIEDIRSCVPLSNEKFIQLIQDFPGMIREHDWIVQVTDPAKAQPLLNLLNVKYVLVDARKPVPRGGRYQTSHFDDFTVMENETAWPRAFFVNQIIPVSSNDEFTRHLLSHADRPFIAMDPVDLKNRPDLLPLTNQTSSDVVAADHYQLLPNSTAFDIKTTSAGIVCLTEEQARDFQAKANDRPVDVFTANRAFKGIYLDKPGNYHVEFRYRPHFWNISCGLFCVSAGIVSILVSLELIRAYTSKPAAST